MSELENKKPFGYNNDTEKEIVQLIFQRYYTYTENPPKSLVDAIIEEHMSEGKAITYEEAEKEVSYDNIMRFIMSEIQTKWSDFFDKSRVGYVGKLNDLHCSNKHETIIEKDSWEKAMHIINSRENMIDNQKVECCECYIGVYWDYENSELIRRKDLEELINSNYPHACTREQYCDRNFYTGLEKFDFCPKCGKRIDWDVIRENR